MSLDPGGLAAIIASQQYDVPLRDPDGFLGPAYIRLPVIGLLFFAAGIAPPAFRRSRRTFTDTPQWRESRDYGSPISSRLLDALVTTFFWGLVAGIASIGWTAAEGSTIGRVAVVVVALAVVAAFAAFELRSQTTTGMTTISRLTEIVVLDESTLRPLTWRRALDPAGPPHRAAPLAVAPSRTTPTPTSATGPGSASCSSRCGS